MKKRFFVFWAIFFVFVQFSWSTEPEHFRFREQKGQLKFWLSSDKLPAITNEAFIQGIDWFITADDDAPLGLSADFSIGGRMKYYKGEFFWDLPFDYFDFKFLVDYKYIEPDKDIDAWLHDILFGLELGFSTFMQNSSPVGISITAGGLYGLGIVKDPIKDIGVAQTLTGVANGRLGVQVGSKLQVGVFANFEAEMVIIASTTTKYDREKTVVIIDGERHEVETYKEKSNDDGWSVANLMFKPGIYFSLTL